MAETIAAVKKDTKSWADMDHDEDDEHEDIGLQVAIIGAKRHIPVDEEIKKEEGS